MSHKNLRIAPKTAPPQEQHAEPGAATSSSSSSATTPSQLLALDQAALDRARENLDDGAVTPSYGPWRDAIVKLLNDSLATELVCVLRYKRHYYTAHGLASTRIAEEFLEHATQEAAHADSIAERIVQLGGMPDYSPDSLSSRSHADYNEATDLKAMLRSNLIAERIAVEAYRQMVAMIGDKDPTTRRLLEQILVQEEEHADELADLLKE